MEKNVECCPNCQRPIPEGSPRGLCPACLMAQASMQTEAGAPQRFEPPPSIPELAAAFPNLEILHLAGQGGMGFVFKARQPKLDRFVALKILSICLREESAFADRFTREGRLL